jgi:hypothetical protein
VPYSALHAALTSSQAGSYTSASQEGAHHGADGGLLLLNHDICRVCETWAHACFSLQLKHELVTAIKTQQYTAAAAVLEKGVPARAQPVAMLTQPQFLCVKHSVVAICCSPGCGARRRSAAGVPGCSASQDQARCVVFHNSSTPQHNPWQTPNHHQDLATSQLPSGNNSATACLLSVDVHLSSLRLCW